MFTGIIQAMGRVVAMSPTSAGRRLVVDRGDWSPSPLSLGDSICVSGVCLTVVAFDDRTLSFDIIGETLARSTLGSLAVGLAVNLEPSLTAATPMGGHFVQGHVDGVGVLAQVERSQGQVRLTITPPAELMDYIIPKGSITLEGVSLTVASVTADTFDVALIPATLALTTLDAKRQGDPLNIETDILSRTIVHHLRRMMEAGSLPAGPARGLSAEALRQAGFGGPA